MTSSNETEGPSSHLIYIDNKQAHKQESVKMCVISCVINQSCTYSAKKQMDDLSLLDLRLVPHVFGTGGDHWSIWIKSNPGCCFEETVAANEPLCHYQACLLVSITGHLQGS